MLIKKTARYNSGNFLIDITLIVLWQDVPTVPNALPNVWRAFFIKVFSSQRDFWRKRYFRAHQHAVWILRRTEMQLHSDVSALALQYRNDLLRMVFNAQRLCWNMSWTGVSFQKRGRDCTCLKQSFWGAREVLFKNHCENHGNNSKLPSSPSFCNQNCASCHWEWVSDFTAASCYFPGVGWTRGLVQKRQRLPGNVKNDLKLHWKTKLRLNSVHIGADLENRPL